MVLTEGHRLLRKWLDETGKTQAELARLVGRSEPSVSFWLRGSRPDGDARVALKNVTGIPIPAWAPPKRTSKSTAA